MRRSLLRAGPALAIMVVAGLTSTLRAQTPPTISTFGPQTIVRHLPYAVLVTGTGFLPGDRIAFVPVCGPHVSFMTTVLSQTQLLTTVPPAGLLYGPHRIGIDRFAGTLVALGGFIDVQNPPPFVTSVAPLDVPAGSPSPVTFTLMAAQIGGMDSCGVAGTRVRLTPPAGSLISAFEVQVSSESSPHLVTFPPELFATPGLATLVVENIHASGPPFVQSIDVRCAGLALTAYAYQGPGSLELRNSCGTPGLAYVTALSFAPENLSSPNTGWWGGLHISLLELSLQISSGLSPFTGILNSQGGSLFSLPANSLPAGVGQAFLNTRTFAPGNFNPVETTAIVSFVL